MTSNRHVTVVADLGYGDAGKGSIVDYLARTEPTGVVVRYNGGAQAAHNVVTPDGRHHTFSQFGSASFIPGVATHLSRFMLLNPLGLINEATKLEAIGVPNPMSRLTIDDAALIITPYHQAANRLRELARGRGRHGSCGEGIGETMADSIDDPQEALRAGDLASTRIALRKLESARLRKLDQLAGALPTLRLDPHAARDIETLQDNQLSAAVTDFYASFVSRISIVAGNYLGQLLKTTPHVVFEGAQGVLLDEWRGFHPYTTWSTTTFANADLLLRELGYDGSVHHLGVLRAYATRHGAGPFVTEDHALTSSILDYHNRTNDWQQDFRVGHFDLVTARYALEVTGPTDGLAITCLDRLPTADSRLVCVGYKRARTVISRIIPGPFQDLEYQEQLTHRLLASAPVYEITPADSYLEYLESSLGLPVILTSNGLTAKDKSPRFAHVA